MHITGVWRLKAPIINIRPLKRDSRNQTGIGERVGDIYYFRAYVLQYPVCRIRNWPIVQLVMIFQPFSCTSPNRGDRWGVLFMSHFHFQVYRPGLPMHHGATIAVAALIVALRDSTRSRTRQPAGRWAFLILVTQRPRAHGAREALAEEIRQLIAPAPVARPCGRSARTPSPRPVGLRPGSLISPSMGRLGSAQDNAATPVGYEQAPTARGRQPEMPGLRCLPVAADARLWRNMAAIAKHGQAIPAQSKCPRFKGTP
jgi:hypothetical protein